MNWRGPGWNKRSLDCRLQALATTSYLCHYCELPIAGSTVAQLDADHVRPGDPTSQIVATHRGCNRREGARHGNHKREPHSERW